MSHHSVCRFSWFVYRFMDELEIQVALAAVGVRFCPGLQIVPAVFSAVDVLK